ncbi:MAG TPA: AI-2E family transporter [Candidatus Limnocylindria bacterium]|nr:AI-2E family transporter [Candidatus Limnocylindria bacterium]
MTPFIKRRLPAIIGLMLLAFALYRVDTLLAILRALMSILTPFIIGLFLALLINLPLRFLDGLPFAHPKRPAAARAVRALNLTISVLLVVAVITILLVVIIPEVVNAVERLIGVIPGFVQDLEQWLSERNNNIREALGLVETSEDEVRVLFQGAYGFLLGGLTYSSGVFISAAQYLFNTVIGLVFAIYLLFSKEKLQGHLRRLSLAVFAPAHAATLATVMRMLVKTYSNFLGGQLLQASISAVLTIAALLIAGFPYAVLIGLITFLAALIPVFGPYIAGVLGALLVMTDDPSRAPMFLLLFFIVQQVVGSVVYPRIMSGAIDIPSIWVLLGVTLGGGIMGIPGMLLFVPLVAVAYHLTAAFVRRKEAAALAEAQASLD